MISDQDAIKLFGSFSRISLGIADSTIQTKNKQLFRRGGSEVFPVGCYRHMEIYFRHDVIPQYCFDCYKVVISPRNVLELFKLLIIFDSEEFGLLVDRKRKCMVEERDSCSGAYKGFIYCEGVKDGNEILKITQQAVYENISPDVAVVLKRGCSEFAETHPKFPRTRSGKKPGQVVMQYKKNWKVQENLFDKKYTLNEFEYPPDKNDDTPYFSEDGLKTYSGSDVFCMQYWLRYAATIGDMSYFKITGGVVVPSLPNVKRPPFISY